MPKSKRARAAVAVTVIGLAALSMAGAVVFGWMIDETHFDRPDAEFDALRAEVRAVDGVTIAHSERWVEAPTFSDPSSSVAVMVDADALPDLITVACASTYPDPVSWAVEVDTASDSRIALFSLARSGCPDFGFDPVPVVAEIDRSAPGVRVQAALAETGLFTLFSLGDGFDELIPLVTRAEVVRDAAGLPADRAVEVAGSRLGVTVGPGEGRAYGELLARLIDDHDVTYFSADAGATMIDGVDKVQVEAPERNEADVAAVIARSDLPVADLPVAFLPG